MEVTDDQLKERLRALLATVDLSETSGRTARYNISLLSYLVTLERDATFILLRLTGDAGSAEKTIRKTLEEEFNVSLSDRKALLKAEVRTQDSYL